ncbi:MAG TPA: LOG family protein [Chloroflexota bacterium]|nr:LOG family protein [Chloroflexota bacterium]
MFGSSRSVEGDPDYQEARELGRRLAECGFTICSGGFGGSMEAVSRGAREGGGQTIGVTLDAIGATGNRWLDEEIRTETIFRRIEHMVTVASGFAVLRGGPGTLAELALTINLLYIKALQPRPLVVLGADWQAVLETIFQRLPSTEAERALVTYAASPAEAARILAERVV